jgi:hypothetical protein
MKKLIDATTTPLASIFGSGFLVIVPILAAAVGPYSLYAMAGVTTLAYAVGSVIRFNIRYAEPLLTADDAHHLTTLFERGCVYGRRRATSFRLVARARKRLFTKEIRHFMRDSENLSQTCKV